MSEIRILRQIPEGITNPTEVIFSIVHYEERLTARSHVPSPFSKNRSPRTGLVLLKHYSLDGLKEFVEKTLKAFDKPVIEWERPEIRELKEY